jgi:hypothetical protein
MKLRRVFKSDTYYTQAIRAGHWSGYASLRAAYRYHDYAHYQSPNIGARLSKSKGGKDES